MTEINRLLIICRGEIAVRIVRAARDLGITSVVAYSDADADSLPVQLADESYRLGEAQAKRSYLNPELIVRCAREMKVDAIHPGYGFLSENPAFVAQVESEGIIWVGPSAETVAKMGDKAKAIETAKAAGVPVVPGSDGPVTSAEEAASAAEKVGFPVMIKASAGGGGRGIRVARDAEAFADLFAEARREAQAVFGDGTIYLERFVADSRHIEVQIMGDGRRAVHFFERDCSLQRRRQKVWEEAPAAILPPVVRERITQAAADLAEHVQYRGAGTVEFLYDPSSEEFFFIEMNTRIQVEHPITEEICGVDLIAAMVRIAGGETLPWQQEDIVRRGHAIEVRINAEDPKQNFMPSPGTVSSLLWPAGPGVRIDALPRQGDTIAPFYDSLLGKLIVWGEDREQALARLRRALGETAIEGISTTLPFFEELAREPDVINNEFDTTWIERWMEGDQS